MKRTKNNKNEKKNQRHSIFFFENKLFLKKKQKQQDRSQIQLSVADPNRQLINSFVHLLEVDYLSMLSMWHVLHMLQSFLNCISLV